MSRRTYRAVLDDVLTPMGFTTEDGAEWVRRRGDMWECVDLQTSTYAGTTANLSVKDLKTEELLSEAIPSQAPYFMVPTTVRIGRLMDGKDHWWRRDPNGPAELSEAIRAHAPPFFDKFQTLDDQAAWLYDRGSPKWGNWKNRIYLAVTLYRMGERDEACQVLRNPPKLMPQSWVVQADEVRRWLGCS